jgi:hypothetical protein
LQTIVGSRSGSVSTVARLSAAIASVVAFRFDIATMQVIDGSIACVGFGSGNDANLVLTPPILAFQAADGEFVTDLRNGEE